MTSIKINTDIFASLNEVFDLSRSIDLHLESTARTNEKAIAGVISGLIGFNETVTWRARHFGIYQNFTSKITAFDPLNSFTDEMVQGAFKSFKHIHIFKKKNLGTLMIDKIYFEAPLGLVGIFVEKFVLKRYLTKLILEWNRMIKSAAEKL